MTGGMGFRGRFAQQQSETAHVRFGSKADITPLVLLGCRRKRKAQAAAFRALIAPAVEAQFTAMPCSTPVMPVTYQNCERNYAAFCVVELACRGPNHAHDESGTH